MNSIYCNLNLKFTSIIPFSAKGDAILKAASSESIWMILLIVLSFVISISAICFAYYLSINLKKINRGVKKSVRDNETFEKIVIKDLESMKMSIKDIRQSTQQLISNNQDAPLQHTAKTTSERKKSVIVKEESKIVMYCGSSYEGEFFNLTKDYVPGKSLFKLTVGNETGQFEVCNRSESIAIAKLSLEEFIRPDCEIKNQSDKPISEIITIEPGCIKRTGDSWKIVRKAKISIE